MKLGRTFGTVREALERAGRARRRLVRRARHHRPASAPPRWPTVDPDDGARTSPSRCCRAACTSDRVGAAVAPTPTAARRRGRRRRARAGRPDWLTPEARAAVAAADDLVGYGPYLDRVPANAAPAPARLRQPGRGRARRVRPRTWPRTAAAVAVVSSGDPGVFAMAAAVLEVAAEPRWTDVAGPGPAGPDRGAGGGEPGRRAARPRLLRAVAVGPAEAVGRHRRPG